MNRRSFLLGLATLPLAGTATVASTPTTVVGIDAGGPGVSMVVCNETHIMRQKLIQQNIRSIRKLHDMLVEARSKRQPDDFIIQLETNRR